MIRFGFQIRTKSGQRIDSVSIMDDVERIFQEELHSRHPFVQEVLAHLGGYRGKRLRPMLVLLTGAACGGIQPAHKVLAAALEMIHTATLVHDDVLDEASTRRHVATINSRWSNETSVLLGDYLFTHAFHLTSSIGDAEACRLIGRATNIVCEGEMCQVAERGNLNLTEEQYLRHHRGQDRRTVRCRLRSRRPLRGQFGHSLFGSRRLRARSGDCLSDRRRSAGCRWQ